MTTTSNGTTTTSTIGAAPQSQPPAPPPVPAPPPPQPSRPTRFGGAKVSTAPDRSAEKGIITGKSGIGKTHFVSTIPGVFILFVEDGLKGISADHSPGYFADEKDRPIFPRNLSELTQGIDEFAGVRNAPVNGKRPYRHFAIDGLTGIETLVLMEAMRVEKVPHMEGKEYKKVWAAAEPLMLSVQRKLDAVRATGVHVWVIAHSAETIDAAATGAVYRKADLLMKGSGDTGVQARNMWRSWANHVFFIDWVTKVTKGDKSTRSIANYEGRVMYTRENGQYFAKTRSRLPVSIPATWEDLAKAMAAGAAATEPKLRAEVDALLPKLSEESRAAIAADLASAQGANRLAAILSRAQGMIAVAASESEEGEPTGEEQEAATETEHETAA